MKRSNVDTGDLPLEEANFALVILLPERVDELHLGGKQRRVLYTLKQPEQQAHGFAALLAQHAKTRWQQGAVNP